MSRENFQIRRGVLEKWSKVFEKSQASNVQNNLPYRETATKSDLKLEDVFEEVKEEVNTKVSQQITKTKSPQKNPLVPTVLPLNRRKSRELVRPKTPGRLGLHQEPTLPSKKPLWQSSTKIVKQKNTPHAEYCLQTVDSDTSVRFERPSNSEILYQSANRCPSRPRDANSPMPPKHETPVKPTTPDMAPRPSRSATPLRTVTPVTAVKHVSGGEPVSQRTARELKQVLFGSALTSFNSDWSSQHINFLRHSSYGLSFYKQGPCGVMACVQAFLMKYLLFYQKTSTGNKSILEPLPSERQQALISAIVRIIWQAGSESNAVVVLPCGTCNWKIAKDYREDNLTEKLVISRFNNLADLERFIKRNLSFFENTSGNGCILFLYSVILSRTTKGVYVDMGNFNSKLMGNNEMCSQSLINLLLTGHAVSHMLNGNIEYDKRGNALPLPLKGIKSRSDIGFLTLNEHLKPKEIQVGSMLKTPKYPIWVVDSTGGRYGIVFCLNSELVNDWRLERRFNLHFYNGTTKYSSALDEIITVDTRDIVDEYDITEDTHPVEHSLRTKWPGAVVEWN